MEYPPRKVIEMICKITMLFGTIFNLMLLPFVICIVLEDPLIYFTNFNSYFSFRFSFFGLFDGHVGKSASEFCSKHFPGKFASFCLKCKFYI